MPHKSWQAPFDCHWLTLRCSWRHLQEPQPRGVTTSGQPADSGQVETCNSLVDTGMAAATAANSAASRRPSAEGKRRIRDQQRLLLQLGIGSVGSMSSLSSVDGMDSDSYQPHGQQQHRQPQSLMASKATAATPSDSVQPAAARTLSKSSRQPAGLYDDDSAADYDPIMLDMLGFTSVAQYLQYKLDSAIKQAKIDSIGAVMWGILACGVLSDMGGHAQYMQYIRELTLNGSASDNLGFLWVYILGYFTVKSCFMSFATGWRAMTGRKAEEGKVQELEKLEVSFPVTPTAACGSMSWQPLHWSATQAISFLGAGGWDMQTEHLYLTRQCNKADVLARAQCYAWGQWQRRFVRAAHVWQALTLTAGNTMSAATNSPSIGGILPLSKLCNMV